MFEISVSIKWTTAVPFSWHTSAQSRMPNLCLHPKPPSNPHGSLTFDTDCLSESSFSQGPLATHSGNRYKTELLVLQIFSHLGYTSLPSFHPVLISWWWHLAFHLPFSSIAPKLHHFFILTMMKLTVNSCKIWFLTWNNSPHPYSAPLGSVAEFYHSSSLWAKLILFKGFANYWRFTHRTRNIEL